MRPLRRPRTSTIHYHGHSYDLGTASVTFSINGIRWEYTLPPQLVEDCIHIVRRAGAGKALVHAKSHATAARCLDTPSTIQATLLRHRGGIASRAKRIKPSMPNV